MISQFHLMMAKLVSMEIHPFKGWIGFIETTETGPVFSGVFTRAAIYQEVAKMVAVHGFNFLEMAMNVDIKKGNKTVFVSFREAPTADDAARVICSMMAKL